MTGPDPAAGAGNGSGGRDRDPVLVDTLDLKEAEAILIERALERTGQNRTKAADLLGISVRTLRAKLNRSS